MARALATSERTVFAIILALLPLVYFYPAVFGGLALAQGDGWSANLPLRVLTGRIIANGQVPVWNPFAFGGMPLLGDIYAGSLYPANWLFALLPPGFAMNAVVITTYHIALVGAYRYARAIGFERIAALITGIIFAFGGYLIVSMGQTSNITTAVWLPWVLLAVERLYRRLTWQWVALGAIFIPLQFFAGVPQKTWLTALTAGAYFLFAITLREQLQARWRFALGVAMMTVCGALLCAIQLLPLRELQLQGWRASITYDTFASYSVPPRQLVALVFPFFFGGASVAPYRIPYWGEWGIYIASAYAGMIGLLLAVVSVFRMRRHAIVCFWWAIALLALVLAFGDHLPFNLNHLLFRMPVYNLFRGSFRHLYEFSFAVAILAGAGFETLREEASGVALRAVRWGTAIIALVVTFTSLCYRSWGASPASGGAIPPGAGSFANSEFLFPILFFLLSLIVVWMYAKRRTTVWAGAVVFVLFIDLASYGHFLEWRTLPGYNTLLADSPSVKFIKARESDFASFRILSSAPDLFAPNHRLLASPDVALIEGLQSANGYDMLQMKRPAEMMGDMLPNGIVQDARAFGQQHGGFNLLNVKYLLSERTGALNPAESIEIDGVRFRAIGTERTLMRGSRLELAAGGLTATEIAIVSTLTNSTDQMTDGAPVLKIRLHTRDEQVIDLELKAGRDTSEWAYDRDDVRAMVKHQRAPIAETWDAGGFPGHRYLARLPFERTAIERIELEYAQATAQLVLLRISLRDAESGYSYSLDGPSLPSTRWKRIANFGEIDLYENLQRMPRAWFTSRLRVMPAAETLDVIKDGKFSDGSPFDPSEIALLDIADLKSGKEIPSARVPAPQAEVRIARYEPDRIELTTRNEQPGFLVLSEVFYSGWAARVDDQPTPIYRTNYALRGIAVPPGAHRIQFVFRPRSLQIGALISAIGVISLCVCVFVLKRWVA